MQALYNGEAIDPLGCLGGYGSICRVKCNHGFSLEGSETRTCVKAVVKNQEIVHWTGTRATCKGNLCFLVTKLFLFTCKGNTFFTSKCNACLLACKGNTYLLVKAIFLFTCKGNTCLLVKAIFLFTWKGNTCLVVKAIFLFTCKGNTFLLVKLMLVYL